MSNYIDENNYFEGSNKNEKYMWLNNKNLQISPEIQRMLDHARAAKIAANYNPMVANPVKVSCRNGKSLRLNVAEFGANSHHAKSVCNEKSVEALISYNIKHFLRKACRSIGIDIYKSMMSRHKSVKKTFFYKLDIGIKAVINQFFFGLI